MAGRKSKYETHVLEYLENIKAWKENGEKEEDIVKKLGISITQFNVYKNQYAELKEALKASKEKLVNKLKKTLWQEALGYEYEESEQEIIKIPVSTRTKDENGNIIYEYKEKKKIKILKRRQKPVASLLIFALCNKCPEEFTRVDKEAVKELKDHIDKLLETNKEKIDQITEVIYGETIRNKNTKKEV